MDACLQHDPKQEYILRSGLSSTSICHPLFYICHPLFCLVSQCHRMPLGRPLPCLSLSFPISKTVVTFLGQVVCLTQVRCSIVIIAIMLSTLNPPGSDQRVLPNIWGCRDRSKTWIHVLTVENPWLKASGQYELLISKASIFQVPALYPLPCLFCPRTR